MLYPFRRSRVKYVYLLLGFLDAYWLISNADGSIKHLKLLTAEGVAPMPFFITFTSCYNTYSIDCSVLVSFQMVIFHVEKHPSFPWFTQCVTFNFFPSNAHELVYNLFNLTAMYLAPLIIIIIAYTLILVEITKKSRESHSKLNNHSSFFRNGLPNFLKKKLIFTLRTRNKFIWYKVHLEMLRIF